MNCRTCHYELSQCLDARLPSGRRAIVMQHVTECETCAKFWDELQRAQELVLQLPRHRTGEDFRAQLFARIQTGEGTPPAVFMEPVPMLSKLRYALTGAAAAAALLTALTMLRKDGASSDTGTNLASAVLPKAAQNRSALTVRDHGEDSNPSLPALASLAALVPPLPMVRELTPDLVAIAAAREFQSCFTWANNNVARLQARGNDTDVRIVWEHTRTMQDMGRLLLALLRDHQVSFADQELQAQLNAMVATLDQIEQPDSDAMRDLMPKLREVPRLCDIADQIHVRIGDPLQHQWILQQVTKNLPGAVERLFESVPENNAVDMTLVRSLQTTCGPKLVILRQQK